jgi:hypothetical protein
MTKAFAGLCGLPATAGKVPLRAAQRVATGAGERSGLGARRGVTPGRRLLEKAGSRAAGTLPATREGLARAVSEPTPRTTQVTVGAATLPARQPRPRTRATVTPVGAAAPPSRWRTSPSGLRRRDGLARDPARVLGPVLLPSAQPQPATSSGFGRLPTSRAPGGPGTSRIGGWPTPGRSSMAGPGSRAGGYALDGRRRPAAAPATRLRAGRPAPPTPPWA